MQLSYKNLYAKKGVVDISDSCFKRIIERLSKISNLEKDLLEEDISMEELDFIVRNYKNTKGPATDGYLNKFRSL